MLVQRTALCVVLILTLSLAETPGSRVAARAPSAGPELQSVTGSTLASWDAFVVASANKWLLEYARLSPTERKLLGFIAVEITKLRRISLKRLIQHDPKRALLLSLSPGQRQGLPKAVLDVLERRVHTVGDLTQTITEVPPTGDLQGKPQGDPMGDPQPVSPPPETSWFARIGQTTLQAFVYGLRLKHQTEFDTPLHGIVLDDTMAVDESPLYAYDEFEKVQLGFQPGQIVATDGRLAILLPDFKAFEDLRQDLIDQILHFGPRPWGVNLHPWTTGRKNLLVIKADFIDVAGVPYTDAEITAAVAETSTFFEQNSQGQTSLAPAILPLILRLPSPASLYARSGRELGAFAIRDDARAAARDYDIAMGAGGKFNPGSYDRVLVVTPQVFDGSAAQGDLGGQNVVVTGERGVLEALAHEFGHTYGFIHSNRWNVPYRADPIGPGSSFEYGDAWDMMGRPDLDRTDEDPRRRHFNAFFKTLAGWLPTAAVADGAPGGVFRLYRHDAADAVGLRAIRIRADAEKTYWLDIRRQFPWNLSMADGVEVRRVLNDPGFVYGPVELLDVDNVTPGPVGSAVGILHSLVRPGAFEDTANSLDIRVAATGVDERGEYADIVITR